MSTLLNNYVNGFDLAQGKCYWVAIEAIVQSCTLITKLVTEVFNSLGKEKRNLILITYGFGVVVLTTLGLQFRT